MPSYFLEEELDLTGLEIDEVDFELPKISVKFGDGYGASAVVGSAAGLKRWRLSSAVMADASAYNDPINSMPSFQYYLDFFKRHSDGSESEIFVIEFRGKNYHASFVEPKLTAEMLTIDLFGGVGVEIEQRRSIDANYNSDGSLFWPPSVAAVGYWFDAQYFTVAGLAIDGESITNDNWDNRADDSAATNASFGTSGDNVTLETGEHELPVVRFTDDNDVSGNCATTINVYHAFIVLKIREATFTGDQWMLSDGATDALLKADTGTTKFANQAFGGTFTYKLNGTTYAENNQQAPMEEFGLVEVRKTGGFTLPDGFGILGDFNGGRSVIGDLREVVICTSLPSETDAGYIRTYLIRKNRLS